MSNSWVSTSQEQQVFKSVDLFAENLSNELINNAVTESCIVGNNTLASTQKSLNAHKKPGNPITLLHVGKCSLLLNTTRQEIIFRVK